jgi:broad specificity polyphosphatase/5'/3'-nucleotidase SurE
MSSEKKARIINEVVKRLWDEKPDATISLKVNLPALRPLQLCEQHH